MPSIRALVGVALFSCALAACGDDSGPTGSGGGDSGTGASSATTATGTTTTTSSSDATASATGTGGAGGGDACNCSGLEVCVYADGLCGEGEARSCVLGPTPSCAESSDANFCGCDGQHGASSCIAEQDTRPGACPAPQDQFWCADELCDVGSDYCELNAYGNPSGCRPLDAACRDPGADCSCFVDLGGGCTCQQVEGGTFEVSCLDF